MRASHRVGELTLILTLSLISGEPARVLRLLAAWRAGELGIDETSSALGADPSLLKALLPALGPALAATRSRPEAQPRALYSPSP